MKKLFTLFVCLCAVTTLLAQPGSAMKFAGPAHIGVIGYDATQENPSDTIVFLMNSASDGDITLPSLTYTAMGTTIPSFTIHSAKFEFDMATMSANFPAQSFNDSVLVGDKWKTITGDSLSAYYNGQDHTFSLFARFSYGSMPVQITYSINAAYIKEETAMAEIKQQIDEAPIYDLTGKKIVRPVAGQIYMQKGKKFICR